MQRPNPLQFGLALALLGTTACASAIGGGSAETAPESADLETLWAEARTFDAFMEDVRARRTEWGENYRDAVVDEELVERLANLPGRYRLLAVSIDGCTDSVNSIPFMARLAERMPGLELRIIDAARARGIMERHPTPDGRAATPTIVLLDELFQEVGCWIERPSELQSWYLENKPTLPTHELYKQLIAWYAEDEGRSVLREIAAMVVAAGNGERICR